MNVFGIILSNTDLWLLGIAGVCIAWFVQHKLAIVRDRRSSFMQASCKLRAAFSPALGQISAASRHRADDPGRPDVSSFLKDAFVGHSAAVEEFGHFVPARNQQAYRRAWQEYCTLEPTLWAGAEYMVSDQPDPLRAIEERIYGILAFAEQTRS